MRPPTCLCAEHGGRSGKAMGKAENSGEDAVFDGFSRGFLVFWRLTSSEVKRS